VVAVILFPAIDVKDGKCVRLKLGHMDAATVFNDDPAAQARTFEQQGFEYLHVVDLNGAFAGESVNGAAVDAILEAVRVPVQLGGGIRTEAAIERWLERGVARVVLGTVAVKDPALVRSACRRHAGRIAIGIDARAGKVAVEGWGKTSGMTALDLARALEDAGAAAIVYTDIDRDGAKSGVNLAATASLARAVGTPVIASGGVAALGDIRAVKEDGVIAGVIVGRALYDGSLDLREALAC
jgi:phosphoribosylformimino-5-aminoimidazole carboxamide ribotide isomerase